MNNENKNFLFSKYFYDKDNEIHKQITSTGSMISLANKNNKNKDLSNSKDPNFLKNAEFLINKLKLKISEFESSENFSISSFHKFIITLLEKKRIKFGYESLIYQKLNVYILELLIKNFFDFFYKNNLNISSEILEIAFKISEPLPNTNFQFSLDYGLKKCNIILLAVLLSERINNMEKAAENLRVLINYENFYKKKLEELNIENYEKDKYLVLTNNFIFNDISDKEATYEKDKDQREKDFKNNLSIRYKFDFSKNIKFNKIYLFIIKDYLTQSKIDNALKFTEILLNLYRSYMRSEKVIQKLFEEKIKLVEGNKLNKSSDNKEKTIEASEIQRYQNFKNYQMNYIKKNIVANETNKYLFSNNKNENSDFNLNNLGNKISNKHSIILNNRYKYNLRDIKLFNEENEIKLVKLNNKKIFNLDLYQNDYIKMLKNEFIEEVFEIKDKMNDLKTNNVNNNYKLNQNIIINFIILSHLFIKFLINFGNFNEAEKEFTKQKELIKEFNSLDLMEMEVKVSNFGYFNLAEEEFLNSIEKNEHEIINSEEFLESEIKNEAQSYFNKKYNNENKTVVKSEPSLIESPKFKIKSSIERLILLDKKNNESLKQNSNEKIKENKIQSSKFLLNVNSIKPANKKLKNLKDEVNSIKSEETIKNSLKSLYAPKSLKIEKSKLNSGNILNFEEYYKKLNVLKNKLNSNNKDNRKDLTYKLNNSKKIFKSDLLNSKIDSKDKKYQIKESKMLDYKKYGIENSIQNKMNFDVAYNSASEETSYKKNLSSILLKDMKNENLNFSFALNNQSNMDKSLKYDIINTEPNNNQRFTNKNFSFYNKKIENNISQNFNKTSIEMPLITDTSNSNRNSKEKIKEKSERLLLNPKKLQNERTSDLNLNKNKTFLPPIPAGKNKIKLEKNKKLMKEIKDKIQIFNYDSYESLDNFNNTESDENVNNKNTNILIKNKLINRFKKKKEVNESEYFDINNSSIQNISHNYNKNSEIPKDSNQIKDRNKEVLLKEEENYVLTNENDNIIKVKMNSGPSSPDRKEGKLAKVTNNYNTKNVELNTQNSHDTEFNLILLIKNLINKSKADYENSINIKSILNQSNLRDNKGGKINPLNYQKNNLKNISNIVGDQIFFHYKNIEFLQNIKNTIYSYKTNVLKIQKKKNINRNFLILELVFKKFNKINGETILNTYLYLDLFELEKKENFEKSLNCLACDLSTIWPILNYLIFNYLSELITSLEKFTLKFLSQIQLGPYEDVKEIENLLNINNNVDKNSINHEEILSEYFLFLDYIKESKLYFLYVIINYQFFTNLKDKLNYSEESNENIINIIDLSNKNISVNITNNDEILLDSKKVKLMKFPKGNKFSKEKSKYSNPKDLIVTDKAEHHSKRKDILNHNSPDSFKIQSKLNHFSNNETNKENINENHNFYLYSQNLIRKMFLLFDPVLRSSFDSKLILKEKNFNKLLVNLFHKKFVNKNFISIIFEEFASLKNYTNAFLIERISEINYGIFPYKFFKKTIFDWNINTRRYPQPKIIKGNKVNQFNPKVIGSIKTSYFQDQLNLNLKNNYFTANDLNKEGFIIKYLNLSKRAIMNRDSIEELLEDGFSVYKGIHRILNNFHLIDIVSKNFDTLINDVLDRKINNYLILKKRNKNSENNEDKNANKNLNFQENHFFDNLDFSFFPLNYISDYTFNKLDEKYKTKKIFKNFTKITKYNSFLLVKIKGFNIFSKWFENILLPWEVVINVFYMKKLYKKLKFEKAICQNLYYNSFHINEEEVFYFKILKYEKLKTLKLFGFFAEFLINLLTLNIIEDESSKKYTNKVYENQSNPDEYLYSDIFELRNLAKINDDNICYYLLKKINVENSKQLFKHLLNYDYIKYKNIRLENKVLNIIKNGNERKINTANNNIKNENINNFGNSIKKYKDFEKINLLDRDFYYNFDKVVLSKIEIYMNYKIHHNTELLPYPGFALDFIPNLNNYKNMEFMENHVNSIFLDNHKISESTVENDNAILLSQEPCEKIEFEYNNQIIIDNQKYIIKLKVTKNKNPDLNKESNKRYMLISLKPNLNDKILKLKITSESFINSVLINFKNLEFKENDVLSFRSFNDYLAKFIYIDKNLNKSFSKYSFSINIPDEKSNYLSLQNCVLNKKISIKDDKFSKNLSGINETPIFPNNYEDILNILTHLSSFSFYNKLFKIFMRRNKTNNRDWKNLIIKIDNNEINKSSLHSQNVNKENLKFLHTSLDSLKNETFTYLLNDPDNKNKKQDKFNSRIKELKYSKINEKKLFVLKIEVISVTYVYTDQDTEKYKHNLNSENYRISYQKYLEESSKNFFSNSINKNAENKENENSKINKKLSNENKPINFNNQKNSKNLYQNLFGSYNNQTKTNSNSKYDQVLKNTVGISKNLIFKIENYVTVIKIYNKSNCKEYTFLFDLFKISEFLKYLTSNIILDSDSKSNNNSKYFSFNFEEFKKLNKTNYAEASLNFCKESLLKYLVFEENFINERSVKIEFLQIKKFYENLLYKNQHVIIKDENLNNEGSHDPISKWMETKILIQINEKRNKYLNELYEITLDEIKRITYIKKHLKVINSQGYCVNLFNDVCKCNKNERINNNNEKSKRLNKDIYYFDKNEGRILNLNKKTELGNRSCENCVFSIYVNYHKLMEYWNIIFVNPFSNRKFSANVHFSDLLTIPQERFMNIKNNQGNENNESYNNKNDSNGESNITPIDIWNLLIENCFINVNLEGNCYVNFFNLKVLLKEVIYQGFELINGYKSNHDKSYFKFFYIELILRIDKKYFSLDFIDTRKNKYVDLEKTDIILNAYSFEENLWLKEIYNLKECLYLIDEKDIVKSKNKYLRFYIDKILKKIETDVIMKNSIVKEKLENDNKKIKEDFIKNNKPNIRLKNNNNAYNNQHELDKENLYKKNNNKRLEIKNIYNVGNNQLEKFNSQENTEKSPEIIYTTFKKLDNVAYNLISIIKRSEKIIAAFSYDKKLNKFENDSNYLIKTDNNNKLFGENKLTEINKEDINYSKFNINDQSLDSFLTKINKNILHREKIEKLKLINRIAPKRTYCEIISNKPLLMINLDLNKENQTIEIIIYYPDICLNEKMQIPLKEIREKIHPFIDQMFKEDNYSAGKRIIDHYREFILDSPKLYLLLKNKN